MTTEEQILQQLAQLAEGNRENLSVTPRTNKEILLGNVYAGLSSIASTVETLNNQDLLSDINDISSSDLTSVPDTFADVAAVQTYLDTVVPEIETRLDNIESKINEILDA